MDLIEKYKNKKDFSNLKNELNGKDIKSFCSFTLYHTVTTPFHKFCAENLYDIEDMQEMDDVESFKKEIKKEKINFKDIWSIESFLYRDGNFEIFKLIIDNFDKFYYKNNGLTYNIFTIEQIKYILQNKELMKNVDKLKWYKYMICYEENSQLVEFLTDDCPDVIFYTLKYMLNDDKKFNFDILFNKIKDVNQKIDDFSLLEHAVYSWRGDNLEIVKKLLEKGANPHFVIGYWNIRSPEILEIIKKERIENPISRKLKDDYECPVTYENPKLYWLCRQSEKHAISLEGAFYNFCPVCRYNLEGWTLYINE